VKQTHSSVVVVAAAALYDKNITPAAKAN